MADARPCPGYGPQMRAGSATAADTVVGPSRAPRPGRGGLPYHPALDGLRALAVLAVMLYHGQVSWTRGGFLGVDLFFVLSGFLITGLLLSEHARTGTVDLVRFWGRRARRLLPALLVVLLAVCVYAAALARSSQRESLRLDALSTLGYVANWRFALTRQSYFAQYEDPSPLRHMWSLGIEEQYYLLFPVLLLVWLSLTSGRTQLLKIGLLVGAAGSALLMLLLFDPRTDPSRVYYGTDTRMQALLVGALLAVWAAGRPVRHGPRTYLRTGPLELPLPGWGAVGLAALLGFGVLVVAARDLSGSLYRGGLLVTAVVCAVLIAGATRARPGSALTGLLSWRALTAVGVISYGLYLWHWPVYVVLDPDRTGMSGSVLLVFRIVVTFALATLSYHLVERPVRSGSGLPLLRRLRPGLVTAGAVGVVVAAVLASTGGTSAVPVSRSAAQVVAPAPNAVRVYVIGDSVAYGLWHGFRQAMSADVVVGGTYELGCGLMAFPVIVADQVEPLGPTCTQFDARWPVELAADHPDVAVLMLGIGEQFDREVAGAAVRFGTADYEAFLDREIDRRVAVLGAGHRPVVLVTVPCHHVLESAGNDIPAVINDDQRVRWMNDVQRRYVAAHADRVRLVDLYGFLCADGYTDQVHGVEQLRTDGMHFTPDGVQLVWEWLSPQLVGIVRGAAGG